MNTKLTLNLDKKTIESAKKYAEKKGVSLSSIVEEYLNRIASSRRPKAKNSIAKLKGILGPVPADFDYKKVVRDHVYDKHMTG